MNGLEVAVLVGVTILVGNVLAGKLGVSEGLVQLVLGTGLCFVPTLGDIQLPPDVVLLLFLPALLYWESLNTSYRGIRRNLRVIVLSAIPLVLATAAVVAWLGHLFGLSWPMAIVLGAVLAPTDATAVSALASRLPSNTLTILRTESLINDGTSLTVYGIALAAAVGGGTLSLALGGLTFVYSYVVGLIVGILIGYLVVAIRPRLATRLQQNTLSVLTPFVAYLPAEALHASGVVAVVTAGLFLARRGAPLINASTRVQGFSFWQLTSSVLNGALFVLVGLQARSVFVSVEGSWLTALVLGVGATVVVILVRFVWINSTPYLIRALDRRPSQRLRRVHFRQRQASAAAGFRGAISLAAALALPRMTDAGGPLHGRELIVAATFVVIVLTIVVQGLAMPAVIRWAHLPEDIDSPVEYQLAEEKMIMAALAELPAAAERTGLPDDARTEIEAGYRRRLKLVERSAPGTVAFGPSGAEDAAFRLEIIAVKRQTLFDLERAQRIDDSVMRRLQERLDIEEINLSDPVVDD